MRGALVVVLLLGCGPKTRVIAMHSQNNSGQDGTATFIDLGNGQVDVTEVLQASAFPGQEASHVHHGRCDDLREIEAVIFETKPDAGHPGMDSVDGGTNIFHGVITVKEGFDGIFDGDHAINTHDPRDYMLYVSCGDLTRE